jgi:RND family efflux transporter MFP subunit
VIGLIAVFLVIFFVGYLPRKQRTQETVAAADEEASSIPIVTAATAQLASKTVELELPGSIQAITEAPILARAEGYLVKRYADIGDRVKTGDLLAEIDAPDLDQQVKQAQATVQQGRAALAQAQANLQQAHANARLAEVTSKRNDTLVTKGVLSKQEGDTSTASYAAQLATVQAAEANVLAARQNVDAAAANLQRLTDLQNYKRVRAPYDGVITLRNTDTGALISNGSTMLFRIAQTNILRIFINVPQANYVDLRVGASARIDVRELGDRQFVGKISRVSGALDTSTRTMLTEIQIPNPKGVLLPGMYAQVHLSITRSQPPVVIPGEAVVTRSNGVFAAVIDKENRVHFRQIQPGRDYGLEIEVYSGLKPGDQVVISPSDDVRENVQVKATPFRAPGASSPAPKKAAS